MEVKHKSKITRIEAKRLSDFKKKQIEPLRDLLLNYVEDTANNIKPNVKRKLIKEITTSKTSCKLQNLETNFITPLRFVKTKKQLPLTEVNIFNKSLNASASKFQKLKRSHVGFELTQTGATHSRAFNDTVRVDKCKIISLGSNVATANDKIIRSACKKSYCWIF